MAVYYLINTARRDVAYPITGRLVPVGRHPGNRIILTDGTVSRLQFLLCRSGSDYYIQDAGSRYGTFIDGARLTGPALLRRGSWINAGDVHLLYWAVPEVSPGGRDVADGSAATPASPCESAPAVTRRLHNFRLRVWWRLSPSSLRFGYIFRRR